ncbi:hypothetical protein H8744_15975 [Oscillospiraceae bacterium N12]|jgi:hypothetical protein|uniref:Lipocalin-like domain-containing protein n=1 Tax=Jilunia laotingensis TaxID=2763675 RepID=A0A926F8C2_9BACT|nr:lipocalin family protein [Jilunia laotingensis]MBC8594707.1 hypothetical protein [Jilunia laotingensis]
MKKINHFIVVISICLSTIILTACEDHKSIVGKWIQPVPGMQNVKQGFELAEGGKASSVNIATLSYERWQQQGSLLILSGRSIGSHQSLSFSDTLDIKSLTEDSLILKRGMLVLRYARETGEQEKITENIPASFVTPAKKTLTVKGELVIGSEVRSFKQEKSTDIYWIIDKTGKLYQEYDRITKGVKNGLPVHAELQVEYMGKSKEGFAANYKGIYYVYKINSIYLNDVTIIPF